MSSTISDALTSPTADPSETASADDAVNCGSGGGANDFTSLRIAAIFIVLVGSSFGALFPVFARRSRLKNVIPKAVFECVSLYCVQRYLLLTDRCDATCYVVSRSTLAQESSSPRPSSISLTQLWMNWALNASRAHGRNMYATYCVASFCHV